MCVFVVFFVLYSVSGCNNDAFIPSDLLFYGVFCVQGHLLQVLFITKTYLYNFESLEPLFYIVKLGF